jgi:uncharacterized membrane protein
MNRTLLKTCTYALMHFTVAIIVAFALTRNWHVALAVGIVEPCVQTLAFAVHERLWAGAPRTSVLALCGHGNRRASR